MRVEVQYFGILRHHIRDLPDRSLDIPPKSTVEDVFTSLRTKFPAIGTLRPSLRFAVNDEVVAAGTALRDGDVVALLPPVAGGATPHCTVTTDPLVLDDVLKPVVGPTQGGVVVFIGMVRDHTAGREVRGLDIDYHPTMARASLEDIIERCQAIDDDVRVAVAHRVGGVQVGDTVVIIAATAHHRSHAFKAAEMCIELIKRETPLWKKEIGPDGEQWVNLSHDAP